MFILNNEYCNSQSNIPYHCLHSFNLHFNFFIIIIDENIEKA